MRFFVLKKEFLMCFNFNNILLHSTSKHTKPIFLEIRNLCLLGKFCDIWCAEQRTHRTTQSSTSEPLALCRCLCPNELALAGCICILCNWMSCMSLCITHKLSSLYSMLGTGVYEYSCFTWSFICLHYNHQRSKGPKRHIHVRNLFEQHLAKNTPSVEVGWSGGELGRVRCQGLEINSVVVSLSCYTNKLISEQTLQMFGKILPNALNWNLCAGVTRVIERGARRGTGAQRHEQVAVVKSLNISKSQIMQIIIRALMHCNKTRWCLQIIMQIRVKHFSKK